MNDCVFCDIATSNESRHEVWSSNESHVAFLDARPTQRGHTLVIPRAHSDDIYHLSEAEYVDLMLDAKRVADRMKAFFGVPKVALLVEGMSVSHTHVHLIPIHRRGEFATFPRYQSPPGEPEALAGALRASLGEGAP